MRLKGKIKDINSKLNEYRVLIELAIAFAAISALIQTSLSLHGQSTQLVLARQSQEKQDEVNFLTLRAYPVLSGINLFEEPCAETYCSWSFSTIKNSGATPASKFRIYSYFLVNGTEQRTYPDLPERSSSMTLGPGESATYQNFFVPKTDFLEMDISLNSGNYLVVAYDFKTYANRCFRSKAYYVTFGNNSDWKGDEIGVDHQEEEQEYECE